MPAEPATLWGAGVKPRKRIAAVSKRQAIRLAEYKVTKVLWRMELKARFQWVCSAAGCKTPPDKSPHHFRGRLNTLLCDTRFWLPICQEHHDWVHNNIAEARKRHLICTKGDWNKPGPKQ